MKILWVNGDRALVECPECGTPQRVEMGEDGPELDTQPCHADECTKRLCRNCEQFECALCGLAHCAEHAIEYAGDKICPVCMAGELAGVVESELERARR